jgi:hypothetical protein
LAHFILPDSLERCRKAADFLDRHHALTYWNQYHFMILDLIQSEIVGASDALRLDAFFIQRRPKAVNDNFEISDKIGFLGAGAFL